MAGAATLVEKATSDLLIGPDWGMNLEICDIVNSDPGQAKDVVKAAKKRLGNKSPKVQILALTVLETLMKNCGDVIYYQVTEKDLLHEMVKIVKKKGDMAVREKILVLVDSWKEAFGGQRGKYPQFYAAYDELKRLGVEFPEVTSENAVPLFTPPQTHPITTTAAPVPQFTPYPSAHEAPGITDVQGISLSDIENARNEVEVLSEILDAIDLHDKDGLKAEVIVELVSQCRSTQQKIVNLVNTTSDETLLFQGLALNDDLQSVLSRHDALSSNAGPHPEKVAGIPSVLTGHYDEEDAEDDFSPLTHRSSSRVRLQPQRGQQNESSGLRPTQPIPPPSHTTQRLPPPPSSHAHNSVDLLSGDIYGDTGVAATVSTHVPSTESLELKLSSSLIESAAVPMQSLTFETPSLVYQSMHVPSDQPPPPPRPSHIPSENIPPPWEGTSDQHLNVQQHSLLYGSEPPKPPIQQHLFQNEAHAYPSNMINSQMPDASPTSIASLPPPPGKNSQRQQFFQQQAKDKLFEDLVDFKSMGAKLKSSGFSEKNPSRPSRSNAD